MYTKKVLSNGLTVLKVPIRGAKSVLVDVFVKVGSRSEEKRIQGISHFLEHLFYKGSRRFPTAQELSHALDAIGAEYNANTGKEHTQYYIKAAKKHFKFIFETLTDMVQNPVFALDEIEREKGVIMEEINMYEDTPMRHVQDVLEEIIWPGHPLGRQIAGSKEVIRKISREDILSYVKTFYQPANTLVAVSGRYDEKLLDKLIKKYWSVIPPKSVPAWQAVTENQRKPLYRLEEKKTEQYHLALGFRSYHHNHPNFIPQIVLAVILGGGMSSRLFTEIRERRGWAYYVRSETSQYQDTGNFTILAGVKLEVLAEVVQTITGELHKIRKEPLTKKELAKAKEYLKGTLTLSLEDKANLLYWFLEQTAFRKKVLTPQDVFRLIDKVTPGDIQKVALDIFQNKKMSLAVVGPKPSAKIKLRL